MSFLFDVLFIPQCLSDNHWQWSFYTYFFILAGFQLVFIIIFIVTQKMFRIIKLNLEN